MLINLYFGVLNGISKKSKNIKPCSLLQKSRISGWGTSLPTMSTQGDPLPSPWCVRTLPMQRSIQSPVVSGPGVHVSRYSPGRGRPCRAWVVGPAPGASVCPSAGPWLGPRPAVARLFEAAAWPMVTPGSPRTCSVALSECPVGQALGVLTPRLGARRSAGSPLCHRPLGPQNTSVLLALRVFSSRKTSASDGHRVA